MNDNKLTACEKLTALKEYERRIVEEELVFSICENDEERFLKAIKRYNSFIKSSLKMPKILVDFGIMSRLWVASKSDKRVKYFLDKYHDRIFEPTPRQWKIYINKQVNSFFEGFK